MEIESKNNFYLGEIVRPLGDGAEMGFCPALDSPMFNGPKPGEGLPLTSITKK